MLENKQYYQNMNEIFLLFKEFSQISIYEVEFLIHFEIINFFSSFLQGFY
jgi:hypothetical protein